MTATTVAPLVPPLAPTGARHRGAVLLALARIESIRLLRHPVMLIGFLVTAGWLWALESPHLPVLHVSSINVPLTLLPLAGATLLATNLAALRSHRHQTDELYRSTSLSLTVRTTAHLLSVVPAAAVSAALAAAFMGWLANTEYAAGTLEPMELAVGPLAVLIGGWLGIALTRFTSALVAAPIAVGILGIAHMTAWESFHRSASWVAVVTADEFASPKGAIPAYDMLGRPIGQHLLYVTLIAACVAGLALVWASGARRRRVFGSAAAVVLLAAGGTLHVLNVPERSRNMGEAFRPPPGPALECIERAATAYCVYPGFGSWISIWERTVRDVRATLDAPTSLRPLRIEQRYADGYADFGETADQLARGPIHVGTDWARGELGKGYRQSLGVTVARRLLGVGTTVGSADHCEHGALGGVAWWAATLADPEGVSGLRSWYDESMRFAREQGESGEHASAGPWAAEMEQAFALLARPKDEVRTLVRENLPLLSDPKTTLAQAAELLKVPAPSGKSLETC